MRGPRVVISRATEFISQPTEVIGRRHEVIA
jgi:hypothetical protein